MSFWIFKNIAILSIVDGRKLPDELKRTFDDKFWADSIFFHTNLAYENYFTYFHRLDETVDVLGPTTSWMLDKQDLLLQATAVVPLPPMSSYSTHCFHMFFYNS